MLLYATAIFTILNIQSNLCTSLNQPSKDVLIKEKDANRYLTRTKRGLREGMIAECCNTICSWEERAEFSETYNWREVDNWACKLSFDESRNCRCRTRRNWHHIYKCGSHTSWCRNHVCGCGNPHSKGWTFRYVHYDVPRGAVNNQPVVKATHVIDNLGKFGSEAQPSTTFTVRLIETTSETHTRSIGKTISVGTSFSAAPPKLGIGLELTTTNSITRTYTWGKTTTTSRWISHSFTCPGAKGKFTVCKAVATKSVISVPFRGRVRHYYYGCECDTHGNYGNVAVANLHLVVRHYDRDTGERG